MFLDRQQGGLGLIQVGHGLNDRQIRPGGRAGHSHLPEDLVGLLEAQAAHGLQQLPQGTHVQGGPSAGPGAGLPGQAHSRAHHLFHAAAGIRQLEPVSPEGVGVHHLAARLQVLPVDGAHQLRVAQVEQLGPSPGGQALLLEHGAGGPVQQDYPIFQKIRSHRSSLSFAGYRSVSWSSRRTPAPAASGAGRRSPARRSLICPG